MHDRAAGEPAAIGRHADGAIVFGDDARGNRVAAAADDRSDAGARRRVGLGFLSRNICVAEKPRRAEGE